MKFKVTKKIEDLREFAVNYGLSLEQAVYLDGGVEIEITDEVIAEGLSGCEFVEEVKPKKKDKPKDSEVN